METHRKQEVWGTHSTCTRHWELVGKSTLTPVAVAFQRDPEPQGGGGSSPPSPPQYLQLLALAVELLAVLLQLPDLAVQLADHCVALLLQLAAARLLPLQAGLRQLQVPLLQLQLVFLVETNDATASAAVQHTLRSRGSPFNCRAGAGTSVPPCARCWARAPPSPSGDQHV